MERVEVRPQLLVPVAAALVGAAGGAVHGRPTHLCSGGGVRVKRDMGLGHVPCLAKVVAGWGDRLGFDVDVVAGVDGEVGAS